MSSPRLMRTARCTRAIQGTAQAVNPQLNKSEAKQVEKQACRESKYNTSEFQKYRHHGLNVRAIHNEDARSSVRQMASKPPSAPKSTPRVEKGLSAWVQSAIVALNGS